MSVSIPQPIYVGSVVTLVADLSDYAGTPEDATVLHWLVRDPTGVEEDLSASVVHDGLGHYHLDVQADAAGVWYWKVTTEGFVVAADGEFKVEDDYAIVGTPSAPLDLRVVVPRARRYCEGPYGPPQGKSKLLDSQLYEMVADACGDIILYTGTLFGHKLTVTSRDSRVGFPTGWATEKPLEEWEAALITAQCALNYFFFVFRDMKISSAIRNEGTEYTWSLSANVIRDYIASLRQARDLAITGLMRHHPVLDRFASNIRVRDQATVAVLEWWDHNSIRTVAPGLPGGQEAAVVPWTPGWSGPGFTMSY